MRPLFTTLILAASFLFASCASRQTPFGRDALLGTDTKGYVAATGGVEITKPDGTTIKAEKLLVIDDENQSASFREGVGLGKTITRWSYGNQILGKVVGGASKVLNARTAAGVEKVKSGDAVKIHQADLDAAAAQTPATNP